MRYLATIIVAAMLCLALNTSLPRGNCQESTVSNLLAESELIAVLKSDAPAGDKAMACKRLAIFGSAAAAPELAKLLSDEKLASWSRIALEAIPGKEVDEVLRQAMGSLKGRLLVGVMNTLGVRRDREAVDSLIQHLSDADHEVASAAAAALGNIGGDKASTALRESLAKSPMQVRSAMAEGCILCAEGYLADGNAKLAIELYDLVRQAEVPTQRIVEAMRGAILARKQDGIPLLLEQLRSNEKEMFYVGLYAARELAGKDVSEALVAEVKKASPEKGALIVQALADRQGTLDLPTIVAIASSGPKEVRIAALSAISRVGDASCVAPLLKFALDKEADLLLPAKAALAQIPDEAASKEILAKLPSATGDLQQALIEVVGLRQIEATAELVKALGSSTASIRKAALESLGKTVPQKDLSILIDQVVSPKQADDASIAKQALETAAIRMPDREACAAAIATAAKSSSAAVRSTLLEVLGSVGGTNALQAIGAAAKDADPQLKDVSTRLLGEWMTIDAAPVLLDIASTGSADKYQLRAVKGYIRIARQFTMPEKQRIEMCTKAMEIAKQSAEQKLVIEILSRYPSIGTLKLAVKAANNPEVKAEATQAVKSIAAKLGDKKEVKELLSKAGIAL